MRRILILVLFLSAVSPWTSGQAIYSAHPRFHPVQGTGGMVSTQENLATHIGVEILRQGGNAFDAAVAIGFAEAVTLPRAGNLGGGGFLLGYRAETNDFVAVDYREKAPAKAHRDMFLDKGGNPDDQLSRYSALAVGVPGTVRGLCKVLEEHGTMRRQDVMAPAIKLAEDGFAVSDDLAASLAAYKTGFQKSKAAMAAFFKPDGSNYKPGEILKQPNLARTLKAISESGPIAFYEGETAGKLVEALQERGGLMTLDDLKQYRAVSRQPVTTDYRGCKVVTMAPPSSGVVMLEMLNILEYFPLSQWGQHSARTMNAMAGAMKFGFADRARHLGDPAFSEVPVTGLLSKTLASDRAGLIRTKEMIPSKEIQPLPERIPVESPETTHFSVMDRHGNAVANTYTLNFSYGCRYMAPGTGFLLNNEMDDFSAKPGSPNAYGLVGGKANAVEPGKRMLSSMCPTIVLKDERPMLVTGSPGGSRIISTVLQIIVNVVDHEMNIAEATNAPRIHHQWLPDELRVESGVSVDTLEKLKSMGYRVRIGPSMGGTQSTFTRDGVHFQGTSDPRRRGSSTLAVDVLAGK